MFSKSQKDRIVDDARTLARDLGDAISPHVERAREEISPRVADARDTIAPRLAEARDNVADTVAPHVETVRNRVATAAVPAVAKAAKAAEDAREQASEARRRGELAAAALRGEDVQRKGRKGKIFVVLGLLGLGAVAAKRFLGSDESSNWQSSYSPSPAPAPSPAPPSPSAPMAGSHVADTPASGGTVTGLSEGDDAAGSTPGESLSDATEKPHPVTTPDSPVEELPVDQDPKPGTVS